MLEEDGIAGPQIDLGGRYDFAFHLAGARAEVDLCHVTDARRLAPTRFADQIANIERRSAGAARRGGLLVHTLAPLALDALERRGFSHRVFLGFDLATFHILNEAGRR